MIILPQNNMDKMQQEAMRRMREMQASSTAKKSAPQKTSQPLPNFDNTAQDSSLTQDTKPAKTASSQNILENLFKDKEKSLILLLILLLSSEKSDSSLTLALMYLLI